MPAYMRDGEGEIAFASQKAYISFYVLRRAAIAVPPTGWTGSRSARGHPLQATGPDRSRRDPGTPARDRRADAGPIC